MPMDLSKLGSFLYEVTHFWCPLPIAEKEVQSSNWKQFPAANSKTCKLIYLYMIVH
jgi:hypothetical protein